MKFDWLRTTLERTPEQINNPAFSQKVAVQQTGAKEFHHFMPKAFTSPIY
jgi:hypothetical protein